MDLVNSHQHKLNIGQILAVNIENYQQDMPPKVMMPTMLAELSHPGVISKQFGNTLFEIIKGERGNAFFKAINADTPDNLIENGKQFLVYSKHVLGLSHVMSECKDPTLAKVVQIIMMKPPMPNMSYNAMNLKNGSIRVVINLGE